MKNLLVSTLVFLISLSVATPSASAQQKRGERQWVDSVMSMLTLDQKIAQMIVVRVPSNMKPAAEKEFLNKIQRTRVGGVCFFAGTTQQQLRQTKLLQQNTFLPLLVCIDAEWGLGMRLKDAFSFPRQNIFGTLPLQADTLVFDMGREIGLQCRKMGIHVNFAPVVDVNSNPHNPVIGTRAFSSDAERTTRLGIRYMRGLQSAGVMAVAKHFPGHGDTETDSHKTLPLVPHSRARLDSIELRPFRGLVDAGVMGVMVAHLNVPSLEEQENLPSTLSESIVDGVLRGEMGFDGLVITDGMEMKGLSGQFSASEAAVKAVRAGNDVLLLPSKLDETMLALREAATYDPAMLQRIEQSCRRVLTAKYRLGLNNLNLDLLSAPNAGDSLRCQMILEGIRLNQDPRIDSVLLSGISHRAYPGCQMIVMRHGQVIYRRCYGAFVYDDPLACRVSPTTMYDLASVTKVTATTLAIMKLVDNRSIALDDPLSNYLPYLKGSNKEKITIRQALSHIARLKAFDAYWSMTNDPAEIRRLIAESPLQKKEKYLYSDLGFIMLADVVEQVSGLPLDKFVERHFYQPMGLKRTCFKPLEHGFDLDNVAPTEDEMNYRNRLIHGVVHDPNAYAL
ncbi:MAG: serine hydrolase, partial [Bacteroidales bacterium]|nr:serine hydrolase [Bacteroidales bacterium]